LPLPGLLPRRLGHSAYAAAQHERAFQSGASSARRSSARRPNIPPRPCRARRLERTFLTASRRRAPAVDHGERARPTSRSGSARRRSLRQDMRGVAVTPQDVLGGLHPACEERIIGREAIAALWVRPHKACRPCRPSRVTAYPWDDEARRCADGAEVGHGQCPSLIWAL
jgi:hypothetical protein